MESYAELVTEHGISSSVGELTDSGMTVQKFLSSRGTESTIRGYASISTTDSSAQATTKKNETCSCALDLIHGKMPYGKVRIKRNSSREGTWRREKLTVEYIEFGFRRCPGGGFSCAEIWRHFIGSVKLKITPMSSEFHGGKLHPPHNSKKFEKKDGKTLSMNLPLNPKNVGLRFSRSKVTSSEFLDSEWKAERDQSTESVTFEWKVLRFDDGRTFRLGSTLRGTPRFSFDPKFVHMNSESDRLEAEWESNAPQVLDEKPLQWKVELVLNSVLIESKKTLWGRLLGQNQFVEGSEVIETADLKFE